VNDFKRKGERGLGFCTGVPLKVAGFPTQVRVALSSVFSR